MHRRSFSRNLWPSRPEPGEYRARNRPTYFGVGLQREQKRGLDRRTSGSQIAHLVVAYHGSFGWVLCAGGVALLIIVVLMLLFGGGGYGYSRWRG